MSESYNPYSAPEAPVQNTNLAPPGAQVSPRVLDELRKTKPWVTFLSILGFVMSGLMGIATLAILAAPDIGGPVSALKWFLVGAYAGFTVIFVFLSLYLIRYGGALGKLKYTSAVEDLEAAMQRQQSFWSLLGIITLVTIVLYVLFLLYIYSVASSI